MVGNVVILYLVLALYCFFIGLIIDLSKKILKQNNFLLIIILLLIVMAVGLRDIVEFSDTEAYYYRFIDVTSIVNRNEFIFDFLMLVVKKIGWSYQCFLILIAGLYYSFSYLTLKEYSKKYFVDIYFSVFIFLSMFFTYTLSVNIIRQGLAISLMLYGLLVLMDKKKITKANILFLVAFFVHNSIGAVLFIYFILVKFNKIKLSVYYLVYMISVILSYFKINIFGGWNILKNYGTYLTGSLEYSVGFKPGVVLFNTLFLLLGHYVIKKINYNFVDKSYLRIYKLYILLSSIFFILSEIPFSDRFGVLGWALIPYLIIPLFSYKVGIVKTFLVSFFILFYFVLKFYFSS